MERVGFWRVLVVILAGLVLLGGCRREAEQQTVVQVTPSVSVLSSFSKVVRLKDRFFLRTGSLIEVEYGWQAGADYSPVKDYRVAVHFVNDRGEVIWQDDHAPEVPMSQWKPGQVVTYRRVFKVPEGVSYPQINMLVGLYDPTAPEERVFCTVEEEVRRKVQVARFFVQPEEREVYKRGWGRLEYSADGTSQWRWMAREATFSFRNPRKIAFISLRGGTIRRCVDHDPVLRLRLGDKPLAEITLTGDEFAEQYMVTPEQLGDLEWIDLVLQMDETFTPADCGLSEDTRRLSLMVNELSVSENRYDEGFYPPEQSSGGSWRWTADRARLSTGNPRSAAILYINGSAPVRELPALPHVRVLLNGSELDAFQMSGEDFTKIYSLRPEQLGDGELVTIELATDQMFVPASKGGSADTRRLGLMVKNVTLVSRRDLQR